MKLNQCLKSKQTMDKIEEESKKKHILYYKSLSKVIEDIQKEIKTEKEEEIINHLRERVKAMKLDKERIAKMFPDSLEEFENEQNK